MNLEQARNAVRVRLGVPASDNFWTDTTLTDLVNEALQAVTTEFSWPWLEATTTFATVAGTQTYTPPTTWQRTKALIIDGTDALQWRSLEEIREFPTTTRGRPVFYTVFAEQLLLAPVPDAVYTINHDYLRTEPALALNTDTPLMQAQYHYAIVEFAAYLGHLRSGDSSRYSNKAQDALNNYKTWLQRITDNRRRTTANMRVRVRPGGGFV